MVLVAVNLNHTSSSGVPGLPAVQAGTPILVLALAVLPDTNSFPIVNSVAFTQSSFVGGVMIL